MLAALLLAHVATSPAEPICGPTAIVHVAEGAPVDRFLIENVSPRGWAIAGVEIALPGSAGRLVFDTVPGGAGINVAQPFVSRAGADVRLAAAPEVADGDERLSLAFEAFPAGAAYAFTIDLDDRVSAGGGTRVSGAEIAGASVLVRFARAEGGEESHAGTFDEVARARAASPCLS
ncbi:MAG: aggregation factor core [Pseudomonadota bacterium]